MPERVPGAFVLTGTDRPQPRLRWYIIITPSDADTQRQHRMPVAVDDGQIIAGCVSASFLPHDSASLLRSYLTLVRSMRGQKRAHDVVLRRDDVEVLAQYLDEAEESVVDRLAALMGATRTQRTAMLSLFASGALLIGLSTSAAASPATHRDGTIRPRSPVVVVIATDVAVEVPEVADVGDTAVDPAPTAPAPPAQAAVTAVTVPTTVVALTVPPAAAAVASPAPATVVAVPPSPSRATPTTSAEQPAGDLPAVSPPPAVDEEPVVDVGAPPIDEPLVDVGTPPLPIAPVPTTPPTTVTTPTSPGGVGEPPFDAPTSTSPEIDPSTVEVGTPPVP